MRGAISFALPHFLVIATALQSPKKNKRFPRELCARFDPIIELEPLTDAMTFLRKRAEKDHRRGFLDSLPRLAPRIDGLNRLAAGNPRLLVFLYDCLGDRPLPDLVEVIQRTVDELTPMYQDVIDRLLNRSQAAVLEMLVANGGAGKAKEIAPLTYQDEQTVRTFLGDLCNFGLVVRAGGVGSSAGAGKGRARDTVFRTHPPLFQIWYEMRHLRRERSLFLVRFFSLLTDSEEARGILGELRRLESQKTEPGFERLLEDVVEVLDPDWGCLKKKYVDDLLAEGQTLADARATLDGAINATEGSGRIGLLVVRTGVSRALGDLAEQDLESAARIAEHSGVPETRAKLEIAWSYHHSAAGDYARATERAQRAVELSAGLAGASAQQIHATALLAFASAQHGISGYRQTLRTAQAALEKVGEEGDPRLCARATNLLGNASQSLGFYKNAKMWHEKSLAFSRGNHDRRSEAASLNNLGNVSQVLGAYDRARGYHEESLTIQLEIGDRSGEAGSLNNLGNVYQLLGAYDRAREFYEESLAIVQEIGDRSGEANSLTNLGTTFQLQDAYDRARELYEKSLAMQLEIGDRAGQAVSSGALGLLALAQGEAEEAIERFREAHELFTALGERPNIKKSAANQARAFFQLATASLRSGDDTSAAKRLTQSLAMIDHAGAGEFLPAVSQHLIIPCLQHSRDLAPLLTPFVGRLRANEAFADMEGALAAVEAVLAQYSKEPLTPGAALKDLGPVETMLARELIDQVERPRHVEARQLLQTGKVTEAQEVLESIVERSPEDVEAVLNLASTLMAQGKLDEAQRKVEEALAQEKDFPAALFLRASIELRRNRPERAIEILESLLNRDPIFLQAYSPLAQLFWQQQRFDDLAAVLRSWRDITEDRRQRDQLDVRIPEAYVLAGKIGQARASMPLGSFDPEDPQTSLHHGLLRVFLALQEFDAERARREAVAILEVAAELPPGEARSPLSRELAARATELLGEEETRFFLALSGAISQDVDPIEFADRFFSPSELDELRERLAEEGRLAIEALRAGRVQGFRDLFRTSTRSIGPAAGLAALGDAWAELTPGQRAVLVDVLTQALDYDQPAEVRTALGVLGKNFLNLDSRQRARSLAAILRLAWNSGATILSRELALRVLNVLYPNLETDERRQVRESLEQVRADIDSPALTEFFNETVPAVSARQPKG